MVAHDNVDEDTCKVQANQVGTIN